MDIIDIEQHRIEKIDSLFSDKVEREKTLFLNLLESSIFSEIDKASVRETLDFACSIDYGTGPLCKFYVTHPIRVAYFTLMWQKNENHCHAEMVKAALIHNCLEKNFLSTAQLEEKYGSWISETISVLTVDREKQYQGDWLVQYYKKIDQLCPEAEMLKVLDKFDNIYALCLNPDDNIREKYLNEIEKYISPRMKKYYSAEYCYFSELYINAVNLGHKPKAEFGYA